MINLFNDITVLIIIYNSDQKILSILKTLTYIKILVVDNGRNNTLINNIQKDFSNINIITNKKNIGFARAVNCGLNLIKTKYVLLLNPDAYINSNNIIKLRETFDKYSNTIIAVPCVYNKNTYSAEYGLLPEQSKGVKRNYFEEEISQKLEKKYPSGDFCVFTFLGSIMMIDRILLDKIGNFSEDFFMYWEDMELSKRIFKTKKFSIILSNESKAQHMQGTGVKNNFLSNYIKAYHSELSPLIYFKIDKNKIFLKKKMIKYFFRIFSYLIILNLKSSFKNIAKFSATFSYVYLK
jgi:GT2 family glycosyltransferase